MFQDIINWFQKIFSSIGDFLGGLFGGKKEGQASGQGSGGNTIRVSDHVPAYAQKLSEAVATAAMGAVEPLVKPSTKNTSFQPGRVRIGMYGQQDVAQYEAYNRSVLGAYDDAWNAQLAMGKEVREAYFGENKQLDATDRDGSIRRSRAQYVLDEHNKTMKPIEQAKGDMAPVDYALFDRLRKGAEYAKASQNDKYNTMAQVRHMGDIDNLYVELPANVKQTEMRISRNEDTGLLRVDVVPKGGTPVYIDGLTVAEANSMVIGHPGKGHQLSFHADASIQGLNMQVATADGSALNNKSVKMSHNVSAHGVDYSPTPDQGRQMIARIFNGAQPVDANAPVYANVNGNGKDTKTQVASAAP